ncbi:GNAT family N-acetyltransferase [Nocardia bovistercoris]|uniref:GNAT family N-acetyltransferase n=1 Tax=Nocardia bovistercoris TaxID=2785916 RepID=A0A931IGP7_9NOCA|nr:GNAT family N-acetyltransferase [Nocardia bovistercoris]MBH0781031.1 GNAT family N-acetyltransferase [Nocardia bovistercoris]
MITYAWCRRLDDSAGAEVSALVTAAGRYDMEAGFTTIDPWEAASGEGGEHAVWHLPIKVRRDLSVRADTPMVMAAYLRLSIERGGHGSVALVVDPRYRSRGIATTLVEELGLAVSAPGGWCGTGATALRAWAYGDHPAAARLTRRFGVRPVARLWTVLRHLDGPFAAPLDAAVVPGGVTIDEPPDRSTADACVRDVLEHADLNDSQVDRLRAEYAEHAGAVLTASDATGGDLGFVWFDTRLHEHSELRAASVRALVLRADARGVGLGAALLTRALERLRDSGAQLARMRVDPSDEGAVRMSRLLSFEQEQAHACYQVGEWAEPPADRRG